MKKILVIGAGRSTYSLIKYLKQQSIENNWQVTIADYDLNLANAQAEGHERTTALQLDVTHDMERRTAVQDADLVISMLPAHMHISVARDCVEFGKNMVTASYISPEMEALDEAAKKAGVIMINEIGVDPGIDHLSAMKVLDKIREEGGKMLIFESFTGGLVAPESDNNPWNYKFTWNPRNVVMAGSGGAVKFIQEGQYKYIPYHQLFRRIEFIDIDGFGRFEGYANRDSLKYRSTYGLDDIPTIYRGTLENSEHMTFRDFTNTFLAYNPYDSVELKLRYYLSIPQDSELMEKLEWIGIFEKTKIGLKKATPAQILQHILEQRWQMEPEDKDMIVMYHKFGYELNGEQKMIESSMVSIGRNSRETAMARTVGLPVAIAAKNILNGNITTPGVQIPITKEIYEPMLAELEEYSIKFTEKEVEYKGY